MTCTDEEYSTRNGDLIETDSTPAPLVRYRLTGDMYARSGRDRSQPRDADATNGITQDTPSSTNNSYAAALFANARERLRHHDRVTAWR